MAVPCRRLLRVSHLRRAWKDFAAATAVMHLRCPQELHQGRACWMHALQSLELSRTLQCPGATWGESSTEIFNDLLQCVSSKWLKNCNCAWHAKSSLPRGEKLIMGVYGLKP
jgi:hypothetical protein